MDGDGESDLLARAAAHGLQLDPGSLRHNDAGLDFHVVYAVDIHGRDWVLRIARRPDVTEGLAREEAILAFASRHLTVAVPEWRGVAPGLLAHPPPPARAGPHLAGSAGTR